MLIITLPRKNKMSAADLAGLEAHRRIYAADFYLQGAEEWDPIPGGLAHPRGHIINVDHHAPLPSMQRRVTSTMLAIDLMTHGGRAPSSSVPPPHPDHDVVVVNHMDCDTILSSGILSGRLPPEDRFAAASVTADHTGVENDIADLLQGLDAQWSREKRPIPDPKGLFDFFEDLDRLLRGDPPSDFAKRALEGRLRGRERTERLVREGRFKEGDGVVLGILDEQVEGELFLPFLPEAVVMVIATPYEDRSRWRMKVRLGAAAPDGLSLHDLRIKDDVDPNYGGRWNAGSNNRGGGTEMEPEKYRTRIAEALRRRLD